MYVVSRGTKELVHVRLSSTDKGSTASAGVLYSSGAAGSPFVVEAMSHAVVVAMESSDQVPFRETCPDES